MGIEAVDKEAFAAIHSLKDDIAILLGYVDNVAEILQADKVSVECDVSLPYNDVKLQDFVREYNSFFDKYKDSVNDKIKAFIAEITDIVIKYESEFLAIGVSVNSEGNLEILGEGYVVKSSNTRYHEKEGLEIITSATGSNDGLTVFEKLGKALLNAEIHMERFIPEKYLSYDKQKDYRILKEEGNIYTRGI